MTTFQVRLDDSDGRTCLQTAEITINAAPPLCGGTAQNVQDAIWTLGFTSPPCIQGNNIVAGVCTSWGLQSGPIGTCPDSTMAIGWFTSICNPGASYNLTITVPWDDSGLIAPGDAPGNFQVNATIDGGTTYFANGRLDTATPQPLVLTFPLPTGIHTLAIGLVLGTVGDPQVNVFSNGNMTITPLLHP